jgi:hypothetical protein
MRVRCNELLGGGHHWNSVANLDFTRSPFISTRLYSPFLFRRLTPELTRAERKHSIYIRGIILRSMLSRRRVE